MQNPPSLIESGKLRFVVMDAPTNDNLREYIKRLQPLDVGHWVRCCEETTYREEPVAAAGALEVTAGRGGKLGGKTG